MRSSRLSLWLSGTVAVALGAMWLSNNFLFYKAKTVVASKVEEMANARLAALDPKIQVKASFQDQSSSFISNKQDLIFILDGPGQRLVVPVNAHKDFFNYTFIPDLSHAKLNDEPALKALHLYNIKGASAALTLNPISKTADLAANITYFNSLGKISNLESLAITLRDFALNHGLPLSQKLLPTKNSLNAPSPSAATNADSKTTAAANSSRASNTNPAEQGTKLADNADQPNQLDAQHDAQHDAQQNNVRETLTADAIAAANNARVPELASEVNTDGALAANDAKASTNASDSENSDSNASTGANESTGVNATGDTGHKGPAPYKNPHSVAQQKAEADRINQEKFQLVQELAFYKYQLGLRFDTGLYDSKLLETNPKAYDSRLVKEIARTFSYISAVKRHIGFKETGTINFASHIADATHMRTMVQLDNFSNDDITVRNLELKVATHGLSPLYEIHDLSLKVPYAALLDNAEIVSEMRDLLLTLNTARVDESPGFSDKAYALNEKYIVKSPNSQANAANNGSANANSAGGSTTSADAAGAEVSLANNANGQAAGMDGEAYDAVTMDGNKVVPSEANVANEDKPLVNVFYQLSVGEIDSLKHGVFQGTFGPFSLDELATLLSSSDPDVVSKILCQMIENRLTLTVTRGAHIEWSAETLPKVPETAIKEDFDLSAILAGPIPHIILPLKFGATISVSPDEGALEFYKSAKDESRAALARSALILSSTIDADAEIATSGDPREVLWPLFLRGLKPNVHYIVTDHGAHTTLKWHYPLNRRSTLLLNDNPLY